MVLELIFSHYYSNLYSFNGIIKGRGDKYLFYRDYEDRNRRDDDIDQNLGRHLKRKQLSNDSNFCSFLES